MARDLSLKVLLQAVDKATGPLKQITQGSGGAARAIRANKEELRDLERAQKELSSFKNLKRQSEGTAAAMSAEQKRIAELSREIDNTTGSTKRLQQQRNAAIKRAAKLKSQYEAEQKQLQTLRNSMAQAGGTTGTLSQRQAELTRRIQETNQRIERQQKALQRLKDADVAGNFRNMTNEVGRFGTRVAVMGGAAAGGIFAIANSTATLGDNVSKTADKLGMDLAALQELRYAAERSGLEANTLDTSMQRMVRRVAEAAGGSGEAVNALAELGLDAVELSRMRPEKALEQIADAMREVDNQGDRVRLAMKLFDSEGVGMVNMLKDGSAGLRAMGDDAHRAGYVLSEQAARDAETFKDRLLNVQAGLQGMKNTIGAALMPAVSDLMGSLSAWMSENRDQVQAFAREFGERLKAAVPIIIDLARGVATAAATIGGMVHRVASLVGGFDNLAVILGVVFAAKSIMSIVTFAGAVIKAGSALTMLAGGFPAIIGGIKATTAALMANPIGLIIGGIALAAGLLIANWDKVGPFFGKLWDGVKSIFSGAWEGIKALFSWSPIGLVMKKWKPISDFFSGLFGTIGKVWNKLFGDDGAETVRNAAGAAAMGAAVAGGPAAADMPIDTRPPITAAAPVQQGASVGSVNITINPAPGMDEAALARLVAAEVERIGRNNAARQRSSLYDTE